MLIDVRSELGACEHLLGPRLPRDIDVGNRSAQRAGVLFGDAIHVLRSGSGQLEDPADIRPRVGEDSSGDARDVVGRDRRRATGPEWESDGAAVGNGARGQGREQRTVQEDSRAKGYAPKPRTVKHLLRKPV